MKTKIQIGGDPEFMIKHLPSDEIVSAIPVIKRDKHNPVDLGGGVRMYSDNVLLETAYPPSSSPLAAVSTVGRVLRKVQAWLGKEYRLVAQSAHTFSETQLGKKPDVMIGKLPVEWEIGCNPSWNAYKPGDNIPAPFADGLRTGSFHIHIGSPLLQSWDTRVEAAKMMDLIVGCSGVLFDRDESSLYRRMLYGKAGEFRPTPYGVEWRVLGNYALRSPQLTRLVFDLTQYAMDLIDEGHHIDILNETDWKVVETAINTNSKTLAAIALGDLLTDKLAASVAALSKESFDMHQEWRLA
jgi:hypothetical protein